MQTQTQIQSLDPYGLIYNCDNEQITAYKLVVIHKFQKIDSYIGSLSYYITLNNNRVFYESESEHALEHASNIYLPELINTVENNGIYTSTYTIPFILNKITKKSSDEVKLNLILPYDHKISIIDQQLFC
jgi:hypothetical protein